MAASAYFDQVQKLYIAYFGRPADPVGLNYWAANIDAAGGNFDSVITGFAASSESQALYAAGTTAQLITSIYVALFNRTPEPAGLAYWVSQIDAGTISGARAAYQILTSAGPGDAVSIANKVTAANFFTANVDTSAEVTGYNGAMSAAVARAYLSKVDATPYSISNLTSNVITQAVADATGVKVTAPTTPTTPTAPSGSSFTASIDGSSVVTFGNPGAAISVSQAGAVYTFTSGTDTATVTGPISGITVPTTSTLTISSTLASGINFAGTGTVALSDTGAVTAAALKALEAATTGLLDASHVTSITSASASDALLLLVTKQGTSGDKIKTAANIAVELGEGTISAANVKAVDAATTGLVSATNLSTISGGAADVKSVLEAATTGTALSAPSLVNITLETLATPNIFTNVTFNNNAVVHFSDVASNSITVADLNVATGNTLTLDASNLTGSNSVELNGFAETSGSLIFKGGAGADTFFAGKGQDTMTGGGGADLFSFYGAGSLIGTGGGANIDKITDFNAGGASYRLVFDSTTNVRAADNSAIVGGSGPGSNVQQSAGGKITFDAADNTLALKVAAVQADPQLKANINTVAFFEDSGNTYVWYSGITTATTDDQLIELTGVTGLTTMTAGNTTAIA